MEEKDFEAKLVHDIDQLDAKIDDKVLSLREELRKWILAAYFAHIRETSMVYINLIKTFNSDLSEVANRAYDEVRKLSKEYFKGFDKISADEFEKKLTTFREDVNRITRSAGLQEIWEIEAKD